MVDDYGRNWTFFSLTSKEEFKRSTKLWKTGTTKNTKPRELPSGAAVSTRLSSNENWQPATIIESEGQIVTLDFTDGRVLRGHKDNVQLRTDDPEMIIDRKKQEAVEQQRLPEESEMMIDSSMNEMASPLMPRQEVARKENIEVLGEEENGEETDKNRIGEDKVREELQPLRRPTRTKRTVDVYQADSS